MRNEPGVDEQTYRERCEELEQLLPSLKLKKYLKQRKTSLFGSVSQPLLQWMPGGDARDPATGRQVSMAVALWKIAILFELDKKAIAETRLRSLWKQMASNPDCLPTPAAREFVKQTALLLKSRNRSTRALGERGRGIVLGILLRPFRAGGKTGRPRQR